ncbi:unnamed protein product [Toxocara canis]|uniref:SUN domain-containing protein n=1 Tax=Toxocara canis TaxID=6265 RepID=A0A183UP41_TOXCA|nr:unnamed protein product [Toxocara canis]
MSSRNGPRTFDNKVIEQVTRSVQHIDGTIKVTEMRKRTMGAAAVSALDKFGFNESEEPLFPDFQKPMALRAPDKVDNSSLSLRLRIYYNWMLWSGVVLSVVALVLAVYHAYPLKEPFEADMKDQSGGALMGMGETVNEARVGAAVRKMGDRLDKLENHCVKSLNRLSFELKRLKYGREVGKAHNIIKAVGTVADYESLAKGVGGMKALFESDFELLGSASSKQSEEHMEANGAKRIDARDVEELIRRAIDVYDADKTGKYDFALESAGAIVLEDRCSATYSGISSWTTVLPFWKNFRRHGPQVVIQISLKPLPYLQRRLGPSTGECWPFEGGSGILTVKLPELVNITAVSYEHLPASLSIDGRLGSAPKNFQIWGYDDEDEQSTRRMLGEYVYDNRGPTLQFFQVQTMFSSIPLRVVEFRITSNYGSHYSCLYRFRVHGHRAAVLPPE